MNVKNLSSTSFDELLDCFLIAFENYFVKMATDRNYYKVRWKAAKVDFNYSYGMFSNGKLIAFIIHAIDKRNGAITAYNAGTGVLPEYRGKRIVNTIYEYALKDLAQNGIEKSTLEVITKNEVAIRSYESISFKITKNYKCFNGVINAENDDPILLKELDIKTIDWNSLPNQHFYSWDNQKESIIAGNYRFFQVQYKNEPESFFIIKPENQYVAQFDLLLSTNDGWNRLFSAIKQISPTVKINNVDSRLQDKIDYLNLAGLDNSIDQYEMELKIG
jgi:ribosomal protein S18 acetylase RimI-like enzyme